MAWKYEYPGKKALHEPTGLTFSITYDPVSPDTKIELASETERESSDAEVDELRQELASLIADERNQNKLSDLLSREFKGNISRVALILSSESGRTVSTRAIQAWLMHRDRPSSRRCPEWAVKTLRDLVSRQPDLPPCPEGLEPRESSWSPHEWPLKHAERHLHDEQEIRERWHRAGLTELPDHLSELELRLLSKLEESQATASILVDAIRHSSSYSELQEYLSKRLEQYYLGQHEIRSAARDLSEGRSDADSLESPPPPTGDNT
jgi:hypothetical protein